MKKLLPLAIAIACLLIFTDTQAQKFKYGLKGGLNYSTISGSDIKGAEFLPSYHGGLFARFTFLKVGIQAEALYSAQGSGFDGGDANITYVQIPLLFRVNFVAGKLGLYLGPQYGYLLSADIDGKLPEGSSDEDYLQEADLSGVIGAEFDIAAGLLVGARYTHSINTIGKSYSYTVESISTVDGSTISEPAELDLFGDGRNSVVQVYIGYAF